MYNQFELTEQQKKRRRAQRRKDLFLKWVFTIVGAVIAALPTIGFFLLKDALNPQTFWEKFAVWGGGLFFLGTLQLGLIVLYLQLLFAVIWDD